MQPGTTAVALRRALSGGAPIEDLARFTPRPGDGIFLPAGTVHSLGGDVVVFEIQQNSDVTFRLYDWDRILAHRRRARAGGRLRAQTRRRRRLRRPSHHVRRTDGSLRHDVHGVLHERTTGRAPDPQVPGGRRLRYSAGVMILSKEHPQVIRYRTRKPVLTPELPEERRGAVADVVFPSGIDKRDDVGAPDRFDVYYGMADDRIGVARLDLPEHLPHEEALADAAP